MEPGDTARWRRWYTETVRADPERYQAYLARRRMVQQAYRERRARAATPDADQPLCAIM